MGLAADIGGTALAAAMAVFPGCVVRMRAGGAEFDGWRATPAASRQDGQYGESAGASATIRVQASLVPAGVTIKDKLTIEILEGGTAWKKYKVNGLSTTLGMYRFELADDLT